MTATVQPTEFPTLDLAELDTAPMRPAVHVPTIEHGDLPGVLAMAAPTVVHAHRHIGDLRDEHQFIDTADGSAVRLVLC
ncbi:MAG: hypothetical protein ACRDRN_21045 [Sciscionella sp.]